MNAPGAVPGSTGKSRTVRYAGSSTTTANGSDTLPTYCRNGLHLRTPDNLLTNSRGNAQCKPCRYAADMRYINSPKGKVVRSRRDAKYKASFNGYWKRRSRELEQYRVNTLEKLAVLLKEQGLNL